MKPKGKTPSLLSMSTGKPTLYTCKKKMKCSRCKNEITMGQNCFQIPKMSAGFSSKKPFCIVCTDLIIKQTKTEIHQLENEISSIQI